MKIKISSMICIVCILLVSCSEDTERVNDEFIQANAQLQARIDSLSAQVDSLQNVPNTTSSANKNDLLSEEDISLLKHKGLANPIEALKADLIKNKKLIPAKGSLGGTMQFYKDRIHVLNHKWVLAYFEDGHNAGEMLLEYTITQDGSITWKPITSNMF